VGTSLALLGDPTGPARCCCAICLRAAFAAMLITRLPACFASLLATAPPVQRRNCRSETSSAPPTENRIAPRFEAATAPVWNWSRSGYPLGAGPVWDRMEGVTAIDTS
jgi:hypothetical protein